MNSPFGLDISVNRNRDGVITIDIDTSDLEEGDTFGSGLDIPRIAINVNNEKLVVTPEGGYNIGHADTSDFITIPPSSLR